ncbi:uncharacterized threonine-rich GPI-anchored glycoprotein PJ4664.02-like [Sander lucioperca]|uniref:uncharacterized threonine-rich GPI-anchored glycoprotein PJ4664.02-like n=1 Tax=Sander lucioperca TaxID=283035 RepID=UPI0016535409|nr:uncharacterized threonine-rich GPI-anchored glycoprotein PJ4664.02-like [Sander lucioperca]
MAISKNGLTIFSLLLTLTILETGNFIECSSLVLPVHYGEEYFLPHTREKRSALLAPVEYDVDVELNVTNIETVDYLRSLLDNGSFTLALGPTVNVTDIHITTVCYPNGTSFQCRCEDQYVWSYNNCLTYGACDEITDETCGCINNIPTNGQYCQPKKDFSVCPRATISPSTAPPVLQYILSVELNTTDVMLINLLRTTLRSISYPFSINNNIQISEANISTVCYPSSGGYQCLCEDQYRWPCDQCFLYGSCDNITDTCGCINAIPPDGQYCQPAGQYNFTACPVTTHSPTPTNSTPVTTTDSNTTTATTIVTTPPVLYEYIISVELNTTNVTVINQLRTTLRSISYPFSINNRIQISEANISTVCYPSSGGYQCLCEDQYRWPCDHCFLYGSCDNITDTCGCINAIPPDGQYCQPAGQYNFTACPVTTPSPTPTNSTPVTTTDSNTTTATTIVTTPPVLYEYIISVELNTTNVTVINQLRTTLRSISYPFSINNRIQISEANISTVCYPSSGGYQCLCEDQYRWPCDHCFLYGSCDNITHDTCGCINAIPPDGQYCQPASQYNFTACPVTTPSPTPTNSTPVTTTDSNTTTATTIVTTPPVLYEYIISVELNTTNVTVINQLRTTLRSISYPFSINNRIQISEANISTVCYPSSGGYQCLCEDQYRWPCDHCFLYGSCDNITDTCGCINAIPPDGQYCQPAGQYNFTACPVTTPSPTPTNSTPVTTTDSNTTTATTIVTTPPVLYEYIISVELNTTNVTVINQLRTTLRSISYPFSINNRIQISEANISTVCYPSSGGYQCLCEDQYRWPCDHCFLYGSCDNITDTCGCINAIPPDGQYCQPAGQYNFTACPVTTPSPTPTNSTPVTTTDSNTTTATTIVTTPPVLYEYIISVELNTTNVTVINQLRTTLRSISYPFSINNRIQISEANISTVCYPSSGGYQCLCEDQYRWPCDHCFLYGSCDNITDTCGCINAIPPDGQYCQPAGQYNFTACPVTTPSPTPTNSTPVTTTDSNTTTATTIVTTPPVLYEYIISVELNTTNVTVINQLRTTLRSISYPFSINNRIQISEANISTVCYPSSGGYQCLCEDQYRWPCDQCFLYGSCDNITDTCGCINAIPPDGQYCQPAGQYNFTACPVTTPSPTPTTPPVLYEYIISVELNTTNVTVINQLRTTLRSISYPFSINNRIQISEANISTVCYPSSGGYQCLCEDQYRWPCDHCFLYGSCDNITDTCGCINAIPPDGQYCQPAGQYNFTACPVTTPSPTPTNSTPVTTTDSNTTTATTIVTTPPVLYEYIISVELNTTNVTVINQLRTTLRSISYPFSINNRIQISEANISTVCYPSSGGYQCLCEDQYRWPCDHCFLYGSCDNITDTCGCINAIPPDGQYCQPAGQYNFTACPVTTPSPTPTNSTPVTTTDSNTTTATTIVTTPPVLYEYIISVELNTTNVTVINQLRTTLRSISYPFSINNRIQISEANISTVCYPSSGGYQCLCEDQYRWPCDHCFLYGSCDNITDTCGCINAIPPDGQYCQPAGQYNFTACPVTTPSPTPTTPPILYEYIISVELNTTDVMLINQLRTTLRSISYPFSINNHIKISEANISTVCYPSSGGYQCLCEDQYRWPCDHCFLYGSCDNITDTCGCINAIPPDGQYCQPAGQYNFTACPVTTPSPTPTTPPVLYEYIISVELNTTDVTLINQLRTTLRSISYPFSINNCIQISEANISTVCYPSSGGYQCLCEDQYRWPCDQCFLYGSCDNITDDTCGCINAIPPEGQYCQPAHQYNFTACPATTPSPPPTNSTTVATTGVNTTTVTTTPTTVTNSTLDTTTPTDIPTTAVTNSTQTGTTDLNTTTVETPTTFVTNSTPIATTHPNTTTPTSSPTSAVTNSTTVATTVFKVEMSMELDKQFTATLNDSTSSEYKDLKSRIESVLKEQYKGITGFIGVSVNGFRKGSIITDFVVQTTQVKPTEVAEANKNIPDAMKSIATVIGSVTADYNSQTPITIPVLTYTGTSMTLTCGPPDINVGQINGSEWKFNGKKITESARIKVNTSGNVSILTVDNVILADIGLYECILIGKVINFNQKGDITNKIQQAPIVQLQSIVNVHCKGTEGQKQPLKCCVQSQFTVKWFSSSNILLDSKSMTKGEETCITYNYVLGKCSEGQLIRFVCKVDDLKDYNKTTEMNIFTEVPKCDNSQYGTGRVGDESSIGCGVGQDGSRTAVCQQTGWTLLQDTCIVIAINNLLIASTNLNNEGIPDFVGNLNSTVQKEKDKIATSSATISAIVDILNNIADVSTGDVTAPVMENILETVDVIIGSESRQSWTFLNANRTSNASSALLSSMESLSDRLVGEIAFETPRILLNRTTTFNNSFTANLNIFIKVPNINSNVFFTTITFSTLDNVMPARNSSFDAIRFNTTSNYTVTDNAINAAVVLVKTNVTVQNVTLSFNKLNSSLLLNPQCVFWNFTLLNNLGAWDDEGCTFVSDTDNIVTCSCNHLTSFSILMATDIPPELREALDIITYFGVGISMASLVMCLIIEGYVWKDVTRNSTSFMRHVSIINTALSLLIADICFIIGASIAKNPLENPGGDYNVPVGPCSTATFFMHFFYLALFFWMLVSGLLLFYRTVMVFSHMSKSIMLAIGFLLGYVCPLIIAVITVAVTAPGNEYIRADNACWLNWIQTHALLALVIPALTIVFINIIIVIVVLFKMLRRGVGDATQRDEKQTLVVIVRCLAILTPLFGLTWALGVGTMISSTNKGIHIAFAFFNSLQGFFILVFGTLFDSKIRSILSRKVPTPSTGSNTTRSTSGGISSPSGLNWINRLRGRRYIYRVSEAANSSSTGASESFVNI